MTLFQIIVRKNKSYFKNLFQNIKNKEKIYQILFNNHIIYIEINNNYYILKDTNDI